MHRKAVTLSMNTIIVAALALIVLVILTLIFTGRIGGFTRGLDDCAGKGGISAGQCTETRVECVEQGGVPSGPCKFFDNKGKVTNTNTDEICCPRKED